MSLIRDDGKDKGKYCSECKFEWHQLACSNYPQCSHIKYRQAKNYSHKETDKERYPFGSSTNPYGNCPLWEQRLDIIKEIKSTISEWWKGFKK